MASTSGVSEESRVKRNNQIKNKLTMEKTFYEMHRSDAVQILLGKDRFASTYTNLTLAEKLENWESQRDLVWEKEAKKYTEEFLSLPKKDQLQIITYWLAKELVKNNS